MYLDREEIISELRYQHSPGVYTVHAGVVLHTKNGCSIIGRVCSIREYRDVCSIRVVK